MAQTQTYRVLRQHAGDRQYWEGDERALTPVEAAPLLALGVLGEKADQPLANKMEAVPHNKRRAAANKE